MSGSIKVGGHTVFVHTGASGAGTLSVQGQNGNTLLTDDGTAVSLGNNVRLPASGGIKDSSGNNVLTESGGTVTLNNGTIDSGVVFPAGHVIDFKTATITNEISSALSNDVWFNTGLSASITPKYTNSKIYIISHAGVATSTTLHNALKVVRTGPATADLSIQSTYNSTGYIVGLGTYTAYDSPNTDSVECIYTLHLYVDNDASSQYYYNYDAQFASTATLSLMEIKQ